MYAQAASKFGASQQMGMPQVGGGESEMDVLKLLESSVPEIKKPQPIQGQGPAWSNRPNIPYANKWGMQ